jgi:hypothetical protein
MAEEEGEGYKPPQMPRTRRRGGLGDLPRPILSERGELENLDVSGNVPPGGANKSADLMRQTGVVDTLVSTPVSKRPPPMLYGVESVYDSRPIQGTDFQHTECIDVVWIPSVLHDATFVEAFGGGIVTAEFLVPENTVAVLREFRYTFSPAFVDIVVEGATCWLQSDFFLDNVVVKQYNQMLFPTFMKERFPTFVIADERQLIKLRFTLVPADQGGVITLIDTALIGREMLCMVEFYGNIILKSGIPKEFEIANALGGG